MVSRSRKGVDPKISYLVTFLRVAEEGGFRRASRRLGLSPVAVMNHVRALEEYFGVKLFKPREGLTPEGEDAYRIAREVVGKLNLLRGLVPEVEEKSKITMMVYTTETPMEYILPCFLLRFREFNPEVDFQVEVGSLDDVRRSLNDELADVGLFMIPNHLKGMLKEFETIKLLVDKLVVVASPLHRISRTGFTQPHALAKYPLILDKPGSDNRLFINELFTLNQIDSSSLRVKLVLRGNSAIMTAVSQNLGVSIIPDVPTRKWVKAGLITTTGLRGKGVNLTMFLAKPKGLWNDVLKSFWNYAEWFAETYGENPPCLRRFTPL